VTFDFGRKRIIYNDPRRFGFMALEPTARVDQSPFLARLGLEPLGADFTPAALATVCAGSATSLKAALLDQTRIAGLGNIYVCEALHRARLSPLAPAGKLADGKGRPTAAARALAASIRAVLDEAIEAGGSTLRDHRQADGSLGYFQHRFAVYDREGEPCPRPRCSGAIRRIVQNGRSTFYCPVCQAE
jgi:formamidopyrimidine-DNA glycosylase